jgi:hypothetical protein
MLQDLEAKGKNWHK